MCQTVEHCRVNTAPPDVELVLYSKSTRVKYRGKGPSAIVRLGKSMFKTLLFIVVIADDHAKVFSLGDQGEPSFRIARAE